jgi:hypothetical protein
VPAGDGAVDADGELAADGEALAFGEALAATLVPGETALTGVCEGAPPVPPAEPQADTKTAAIRRADRSTVDMMPLPPALATKLGRSSALTGSLELLPQRLVGGHAVPLLVARFGSGWHTGRTPPPRLPPHGAVDDPRPGIAKECRLLQGVEQQREILIGQLDSLRHGRPR